MDFGEEFVAEYLKYVKACALVNTSIRVGQTDIDVLGINFQEKIIYNCQVAIHIRGLQYVSSKEGKKKKDNYGRLKPKFEKSIEFIQKNFKGLLENGFKHKVYFFSPIVNSSDKKELEKLKEEILNKYSNESNIDFFLVINKDFLTAIEELRKKVADTTTEIKEPIARFLQVEQLLKKKFEKLKEK
jgi:hypothetical protein